MWLWLNTLVANLKARIFAVVFTLVLMWFTLQMGLCLVDAGKDAKHSTSITTVIAREKGNLWSFFNTAFPTVLSLIVATNWLQQQQQQAKALRMMLERSNQPADNT